MLNSFVKYNPFQSRYFAEFSVPEYAVAGNIAEETIVLPIGQMSFPVSMVNQLRTWGMVVEIEDGKVILREPLQVSAVYYPNAINVSQTSF